MDIISLTSGASHFFGFHDLTPWNTHTNELVCLHTESREDHIPNYNDVANVVIINEDNRTYKIVGQTNTWNWQKAARQRWLPNFGQRVIFYNASNENGFESRIVDLDNGIEKILPLPLYDICDQKRFGLTVNFRSLYQNQPGYGYDHPATMMSVDYERDGIFRVDIESGQIQLILSLEECLNMLGLDKDLGEHYFTHIQISPDGDRFLFIHRCTLRSGGMINHLLVANTDGTGFRKLLDDKISHFDWKDDNHVIVWCRKNPAIKKLKESKFLTLARTLYRLSRKIRINVVRQGLYNESFREIDIVTGDSAPVGKGVLVEDGHPQVNPNNKDIWVNDTYPDSNHLQTLMIYHQPSNTRKDIIKLSTQPSIQETSWRCDLHPRWHPNGNRICVDSAHLGRRQLYIVDVENEIQQILGAKTG